MSCEDWPSCGHEHGCCPDFDPVTALCEDRFRSLEIIYWQCLNYSEVQVHWKRAWDRLPSPYRNDSCLTFYERSEPHGRALKAHHDMGEVFLWSDGSWVKEHIDALVSS